MQHRRIFTFKCMCRMPGRTLDQLVGICDQLHDDSASFVSKPHPLGNTCSPGQWALLDVTKENFWNANESFVVGDSLEVGPGRLLGPSGPSVSASGPTSTFDGPFSNTTAPAFIVRHSSNQGGIIGGAIGGVAAIFILVAALFFYRRRRRLASFPVFDGDTAFDPYMDQGSRSTSSQGTVSSSFPETSTSLLRPYYLDYPITYSDYRVTSPPPAYVSGQVPSLSPGSSLYAVGTMPGSQGQGYQGLPVPTARFYPLNRSQQ